MKPIIMSTEDVRALLDGRKTMMRTPIVFTKPYNVRKYNGMTDDGKHILDWSYTTSFGEHYHGWEEMKAPYNAGDVLYVQEKWRTVDYEYRNCMWSAAVERVDGTKDICVSWYDNSDVGIPYEGPYSKTGWQPPRHMPREAARLFLRVKDVRVERVQDISAEDCEAEGYFETAPVEPRPRSWFSAVWDARNAVRGYSWESNPWTWVIEFEGCDPE